MKLDHAKQTWRIRGPLDAADVPQFEYRAAERDVAFINAELAFRSRKKTGLAMIELQTQLWLYWDAMLPLRWQIRPQVDLWSFRAALAGPTKLRQARDSALTVANRLRPQVLTLPRSKQEYRFVNTLMKPALQALGYRSLAHFERAFMETG